MIQLPINIDYSGKVVVVTGAGGLISVQWQEHLHSRVPRLQPLT